MSHVNERGGGELAKEGKKKEEKKGKVSEKQQL